jgi:tetratricopeptide (TPR) repeat protein
MQIRLSALVLICATIPCAAQTGKLSDWPRLIKSGKCSAARSLCAAFTIKGTDGQRAEAQKCMANVAICGNDMMMLQGDDVGGGTISGSFKPEAIDEAIEHLNLGIKLTPQDLSIHQGRLHILEVSGRYSEMSKALADSCAIYKGKEVPDAWLAYSVELNDLRQYNSALEFMQVMDKCYPNSSDILGNIGAFLSYLEREREAIAYLEKAVKMSPSDPINTWDLGRAYDYSGQVELADKLYKKGISLMTDTDQRKQSLCLYGQFLDKKLNDQTQACELEKKNCPDSERSACTKELGPAK